MSLKIDDTYWSKVLGLDIHAKLVGMFLMTNPSANQLGFYRMPISFISKSLNTTDAKVLTSIDSLVQKRFCAHDIQSDFFWVVDMLHVQYSDVKSVTDNRFKNLLKQVEGLSLINPPGFFKVFLAYYEDKLGAEFVETIHSSASQKSQILDQLSPAQAPLIEVKGAPSKAKTKKEADMAVLLAFFDEFWAVYPRGDGKQDALKAMKALAPDEELRKLLLEGARKYKALCDANDTEDRFIKTPGPWIRGKHWEDNCLERTPNGQRSSSCMTQDSFKQQDYTSHQSLSDLDDKPSASHGQPIVPKMDMDIFSQPNRSNQQ